ncbi:MAG TPA: DUF2171 domain-containing protein [Solirubrobacterales bacterium]|nr:DUF2171 domain-containing protein [Solirubrobacterales bacterium]
MEDLGQPSSYLSLQKGVQVYSSDGKGVGRVEHVLAVANLDLFEGIVLDKSVLPGGHRFVDAPEVEEVYERGVVLKIDAAQAERLPEPSANPGEIDIGPDDLVQGKHEKLRRAWGLLSGKG